MLSIANSASYIDNYVPILLLPFFSLFFFLIIYLLIYLACTATYSECLVGQKIASYPQQVAKDAEFSSEQLTAALLNYLKYSCILRSKAAVVNPTSPSHIKPFCQDFSLKHIIVFVIITLCGGRRKVHYVGAQLLESAQWFTWRHL